MNPFILTLVIGLATFVLMVHDHIRKRQWSTLTLNVVTIASIFLLIVSGHSLEVEYFKMHMLQMFRQLETKVEQNDQIRREFQGAMAAFELGRTDSEAGLRKARDLLFLKLQEVQSKAANQSTNITLP